MKMKNDDKTEIRRLKKELKIVTRLLDKKKKAYNSLAKLSLRMLESMRKKV